MYDLSDDEIDFQLQSDSGSVTELRNEPQTHFLTEFHAPLSPLSEGIAHSTSDIQLPSNNLESNASTSFADTTIVETELYSDDLEDTDDSQPSTEPDDDDRSVHHLDHNATWNDLTQFLTDWASRSRCSDASMTDLMAGLRELNCAADFYLPKHFKTVTKAQAQYFDDLLGNRQINGVRKVLELCGNCWFHEFDQDDLQGAYKCVECQVATVVCGYHRCRSRIIASSLMGRRSPFKLPRCPVCEVSKKTMKTRRVYLFDIKSYIAKFFANIDLCTKALEPFNGLYDANNSASVTHSPEWQVEWAQRLKSLPYKSEIWHGERFHNHPIWSKWGSMRSLLLSVFFDNFPPFKGKSSYSMGVLSASVLNLSNENRAARGNSWPLAIIEGPKGVGPTFFALKDVFEQMAEVYDTGILVEDALSKAQITVHAALALVIADNPALAKIGAHKGHSSYYSCHRCGHVGHLCGHVTNQGAAPPARYDNHAFHPGPVLNQPRLLISGTPRKKDTKNGEHIVWIESLMLMREHLENDVIHKRNQHIVWQELHAKNGWSKTRLNEWVDQFRSNGLSPLQLVPTLSLVDDLPTESMHYILKGFLQDLAKYTFQDNACKDEGNVYRTSAISNAFELRMSFFKLPPGIDGQQGLSSHVDYAKAESLHDLVRVQALLCVEGLIPHQFMNVWRLMSQVVCGLLHTHVPKAWVEHDLTRLVHELITCYKEAFSECAMVPNWHLLLHSKIDFDNWSTLRSHWAFPGERMIGHFIKQLQSVKWSHLAAAAATSVPRILAKHKNEHDVTSESFDVQRSRHIPTKITPLEMTGLAKYVAEGFAFVNKTNAPHRMTWKIDDYLFCNSVVTMTPKESVFKVVGILRKGNDLSSMLILKRVVNLTTRPGYCNTFQCPHPSVLESCNIKVLKCWLPPKDTHVCGVAIFCGDDLASRVLVPTCGELPYWNDGCAMERADLG